jgi:acetyl esterase/lipase
MGFSAGGHLVANISTHFDKRAYAPVDAADKLSCRPDFAVAVYPGHMTENTKTELALNPEIPVTARTPRTFLVQAEDDNVDGVQQSLVYYIALKKAGVPVEMHLFAQGGHAFGLRPTKLPITRWPRLVELWLQTIGITAGTRDERPATSRLSGRRLGAAQGSRLRGASRCSDAPSAHPAIDP